MPRSPDPTSPARLKVRPLPAYLGTQASWFFAFGAQTVVFPYIALTMLQLSPAAFGAAQSSLTLPSLALLLMAGVLAERVDRRRLLIGLHLVAVVPPLVVAVIAVNGQLSAATLICYGLAVGTVGAFMMPARDAALNAVATAHGGVNVQRAVVITSLVHFLAQVSGMAAAAGLALTAMGTPAAGVLVMQSAALAIGAVAAYALPPLAPTPDSQAAGVRAAFLDGLRTSWRDPILRAMTTASLLLGVLVVGCGFFVLLPLIVVDTYGGGLALLGACLTTFWIGAAAANGALAAHGHINRPGRLLAAAYGFGGLAFIGFLATPPLVAFFVLVFSWGASAGLGIALSRSIVQDQAPHASLARVLSIYQFGFVGGAPLGALAGGALVDAFGVAAAATVPFMSLCGLALWLMFFTRVGALRSPAQDTMSA